jgi:hypothetical protein
VLEVAFDIRGLELTRRVEIGLNHNSRHISINKKKSKVSVCGILRRRSARDLKLITKTRNQTAIWRRHGMKRYEGSKDIILRVIRFDFIRDEIPGPRTHLYQPQQLTCTFSCSVSPSLSNASASWFLVANNRIASVFACVPRVSSEPVIFCRCFVPASSSPI